MRKQTELSANIRGMVRSEMGWGYQVVDGVVQGGSGKMLPNALAVLAAAESRFMFWLVKLSDCRGQMTGAEHDNADQTGSATLSGVNSGE